MPANLQRRAQAPRLKFVQLHSAGADADLGRPIWDEVQQGGGEPEVVMATAAGVHIGCIPQYFIMTTLALYHKLQEQIIPTQTEKRWPSDQEVGGRMFIKELRGKTVGILGYGQIGRESARLAHAFGAKIIAANSSGQRKPQEEFRLPGTGDPDGSLPSAWYSTSDPTSLATFLSLTDVLLLALPSTPSTKHILDASTLAHLKPSSILVNIGRGPLVHTPSLLAALDQGKLAGAALDVTDPEPLPDGHALYGRRNVIVTPHLSGRTEGYWDYAMDILEENVARWREGRELVNVVDPKKGY
ncbi:hypothetical protein PUNSTDRAFT_77284 [Punctularia strigosozonata HHB-11173 SS5]|uniref:D-isomer specific 2-hydroxyacid dehydrogenase NAD-binding domain-containing protein n=1 Tax=Punctularia strigosozonata (strain HHB-11173) TaxID=741275 RepID=R7S1E7_PUNST|nr:uncharacterized protein PUNSTDRAFT_77284 [Punctularia strigosozonata HHB-11173 SS5]EIN04048.1 hypothetical protein PUNSTDRAFT_77284 [Punctularia strigosozonata HHB-11173 SS5]